MQSYNKFTEKVSAGVASVTPVRPSQDQCFDLSVLSLEVAKEKLPLSLFMFADGSIRYVPPGR